MLTRGMLMAASQARFRDRYGTPVTFSGQTLYAEEKAISEGQAGLAFLGRMALGHYTAAADPRGFWFSPKDFAPVTSLARPEEGDILVCRGMGYQIVNVDPETVHDTDLSLRCSTYRILMGDASLKPVFDTEQAQQWRPNTLRSATDPISLNVKDVGENSLGNITAFFVPLTMEEKLGSFGSLDLRVNTLFTDVLVKLGDVIYRPALKEAWAVISPSERQPGTGLIRAQVKLLTVTPSQIKAANP